MTRVDNEKGREEIVDESIDLGLLCLLLKIRVEM
jgi:hypothetical protein